jgi:glycerophosphoryl diester phosphodiesterase
MCLLIFWILAGAVGGSAADYKLIAHRGGVVDDAKYAENSPASLIEAARRGYWMIEVDIRESKDGELIMQHDPDFKRFYDHPGLVAEMPLSDIRKLRATPGGSHPMTFAEMCALARKHGLRLMMDSKGTGHPASFYRKMEQAMIDNGLLETAYFIGTEESQAWLRGRARIGKDRKSLEKLLAAGADPRHYFLFEWGKTITEQNIRWAMERNLPVVPSINTFHYGDQDPVGSGKKDIERLKRAGVTLYQIDSIYESALR